MDQAVQVQKEDRSNDKKAKQVPKLKPKMEKNQTTITAVPGKQEILLPGI